MPMVGFFFFTFSGGAITMERQQYQIALLFYCRILIPLSLIVIHHYYMSLCLSRSATVHFFLNQAAATVWLLPVDDDALDDLAEDDAVSRPSSFFDAAIAMHFSFLSSCFICCSLHSKLQKAVSPLFNKIIYNQKKKKKKTKEKYY